MPHLARTNNEVEFLWGKKRGVGGKNRGVRFYESFTYDGDEYSLYDCAYFYKEGMKEPYIGKIVKIWEQPDRKKKVKALWFFHPMEIRNWLNDYQPIEKEIFLATGEGKGISNINPLEAIAGKCNVVCSSTDQRNPQPLEEELKMADYIFHCTFDVGTLSISDKIGDSVAGIEGQIAKSATADVRANGKLKIENNGTTVSEKDQILSDKLDDRPLKKMKATVASEKVKDDIGLSESAYNSDKEDKTDKQSSRPSNGTLLKSSLDRLPSKTEKLQNQTSELAKKQEIDKSNWFKQEPWEDKMKTAAEEGTLVLLQNLDPSNTSKDVEPNTIEYEMAMDWELLQEKSKEQWKVLNKGHENEVKQLKKHWKMK
ncbi:hypothetical protein QJS10_CPB14g01128 [Acorus calamus]|uniref:BAH domain-containing protein n=1 Tax=Acorus calamus TaxID=4465 RepID=A0AAV9DEB0_ACOCL|nr:hypothetical protein QJS10_CPB14g01128 [Acorus calamus]